MKWTRKRRKVFDQTSTLETSVKFRKYFFAEVDNLEVKFQDLDESNQKSMDSYLVERIILQRLRNFNEKTYIILEVYQKVQISPKFLNLHKILEQKNFHFFLSQISPQK